MCVCVCVRTFYIFNPEGEADRASGKRKSVKTRQIANQVIELIKLNICPTPQRQTRGAWGRERGPIKK